MTERKPFFAPLDKGLVGGSPSSPPCWVTMLKVITSVKVNEVIVNEVIVRESIVVECVCYQIKENKSFL